MKKKIISLSVLGGILLLLVILYFAVISPLTAPAPTKEEVPTLLEGEALGPNNRILLFPAIEKADVDKIHVHNPSSDYTFYHDYANDEFFLEGSKNTPYDTSIFETELLACSRNPLAIQRVSENETDLAKYGLDSNETYFEISNKNGDKYKVFVGDRLVTGGGYYCRADGRNAVYVLDAGTEVFTLEERKILSPLLSLQMNETDYFTCPRCTIWRDGETFIDVVYQDQDDRALNGTTSQYFFNYPEGYTPNTTKYQEILLALSDFRGSEVLKFGNADETFKPEELKEYGLDTPMYIVTYEYNEVENIVLLSKQNGDGTFYAYSMLFNTVVLIDEESAGFVTWDIMPLIDRPIFQMNILAAKKIEIDPKDGKGARSFTPVAAGDSLGALLDGSGSKYSEFDTTNFKRLYQKMLEIKLEDVTESDSEENEILSFRVTSDKDKVYEYRFYAYSTRRCYFTINGKGEFYCLRDSVELVKNNLARFEAGEEIDISAKY